MSGLFIVLEGIDGSGKSTQFEELVKKLSNLNLEVIATREPGGTILSEAIRELLLNRKEGKGMDQMAELLLFLAARAQLLNEVIRPALDKGAVVIADRFALSSVAYQGGGRELGTEWVAKICCEVFQDTIPNLNILVDVQVDEGAQYSSLGPTVIVNGKGKVEEVFATIWKEVGALQLEGRALCDYEEKRVKGLL